MLADITCIALAAAILAGGGALVHLLTEHRPKEETR